MAHHNAYPRRPATVRCPNPTQFTGEEEDHYTALRQFKRQLLNKVDIEYYGCDNTFILNYTIGQLGGVAEQIISEAHDKEPYNNVREILADLEHHFGEKFAKEDAKRSLHSCHMKAGETFASFYARWSMLCSRANIIDEEAKKDYLTRALPSAFATRVLEFAGNQYIAYNFEQLVDACRRRENTSNIIRHNLGQRHDRGEEYRTPRARHNHGRPDTTKVAALQEEEDPVYVYANNLTPEDADYWTDSRLKQYTYPGALGMNEAKEYESKGWCTRCRSHKHRASDDSSSCPAYLKSKMKYQDYQRHRDKLRRQGTFNRNAAVHAVVDISDDDSEDNIHPDDPYLSDPENC